jgi:hypothetical protein
LKPEVDNKRTVQMNITVDDQLLELYVDGVLMNVTTNSWDDVRTVDIPADTKLIAVMGRNFGGVSILLFCIIVIFINCFGNERIVTVES